MVTHYDEFSMFNDNAEEVGLSLPSRVSVRRTETPTPWGTVSALMWGEGEVEVVFLHGGAQNAHTWDTVNLALQRPAMAIDLPGHGHSQWRSDRGYGPWANAETVAVAIGELAPRARVVVGMSQGGLTTIRLAARHPSLVARAVIVDVTPGVNSDKSKLIRDFVVGPRVFASFDEILARTMEHNPTRSESSLRRGILHNACEGADGTWAWRYDQLDVDADGRDPPVVDYRALWDDVSAITCPLLLAVGTQRGTVVDDADVAEFRRRQPATVVEYFTGSGHSLQGDEPLRLARTIEMFAFPADQAAAERS